MGTAATCKASVRPLYAWEVEQARLVFNNSLQYERVRVHECTTWTNAIDRIGRRLKGMPPSEYHNAITLGNHCFFPVKLPDSFSPPGEKGHDDLCWLIHELTHAWQFQHMGWSYLFKALDAQIRQKGAAYDFGQAEGLKMRRRDGWDLRKFNLEQQGDIARSYYYRLCRGQDVSDWLPYIEDIQRLA